MILNADNMHFRDLNDKIRNTSDSEIEIVNCLGQRYIASGLKGKNITIDGIPGNALGAYLDGCMLKVNGSAQDATGDTMNDGEIVIDGSSGDATGYAMRGGSIYIHENVGYRAGIHMKAYKDKKPFIIAGGTAGSFLGEYQAGGCITVLGLKSEDDIPVNNFCGMGMYGGKIYLRTNMPPTDLSERLIAKQADDDDMSEIMPQLERFSLLFKENISEILSKNFYVITPDSKNPYKQMYTAVH